MGVNSPHEAMPPLEEFRFIEFAANGANKRNQVCLFTEFSPPRDVPDIFATWFHYTDALPTYLAEHRNADGHPSIEGFAGPAYAPRFVADFDCADNLELAQRDAITFITRLGERFEVSPNAIDVAFSGSKGFSVELPGSLFGGFEPLPAPFLAARLKVLASILGEGLTTLDYSTYQRTRLWRQPNTIHSKSRLYKAPLTVHEIKTLDIAAIKAIAASPRDVDRPPDDDWSAVPGLEAVWREASDLTRRQRSRPADQHATRRFTDSQVERFVSLLAPHWCQGQKHDMAVCTAGYLATSGFSEAQTLNIVECLAAKDERPSDRVNSVRSTFARWRAGEPVRGYSGLSTLLTADVLASAAQLVLDAETEVIAGGRRYRRAPEGDPEEPPQDNAQPNTNHSDDFDDADFQEGNGSCEDASSESNRTAGCILDSLRHRIITDPSGFARETLSEPETLGALARAAREDRGTYEAFLIWIQEQGIRAGDIKRIERAVNDALRRGRPKFRTIGPDEAMDAPRVKDAIALAPVTDQAVVPYGYRLATSGIVEESLSEDGERRIVPVAPVPVVITGRLIDVADGKESLRLAWTRDDRWREHTVDRAIAANARELVGLSGIGFPVTSRTAGDLVGYVASYEAANISHLPRARVSRQLGWQGHEGSLGFLLGRSLIRSDGEDAGEINLETTPPDEWDAEWVAYHGSGEGADQLVDAFTQAGSFEAWAAAAEKASRFPRVALSLYGSLAACLLDIFGTPNFAIDWSFLTSTGKTTTLRLGGSIWGNPNEQSANSVVNTWDATRVWIERASEILNCLPLILDDTARAKQPKLVAQTIYDVTQGRGRGRGSPQGMRRSGTWSTILLSTGEAPATTFTEDGGTRARTLVLWGSPFGRADESTAPIVNDIGLGVRLNYGHAGPRFVRYLLQNRHKWDHWRSRYGEIEQTYLARAEGNPVAGRLAKYFAILEASARLAHRALELPWDYQQTVDALWDDLVHEASEADRAKAALAMVMSWAHANAHTFEGRLGVDQQGYPRRPSIGVSGKWEGNSDWESIAFYPHRVKELLENAGHQPDAIFRTWRDREWLETSGDRNRCTKGVRIMGEKTWAVVIRRSATEEPAEEVQ